MTEVRAAASERTCIRAVRDDDYEPIQALFARAGWFSRSVEGWRWAFDLSPAMRAKGADTPKGWVIDDGGHIGGYLGHIPQRYWLNGYLLWGATCTSYLVEEPYRKWSVNLLRTLFLQKGFDFVFSTTANAVSGPIYVSFKATQPPDAGLDRQLLWITHDGSYIRHAMARAGLSPLSFLSGLIGGGLNGVRRISGYATLPTDTFDGKTQVHTAQWVQSAAPAEWAQPVNALWEQIKQSPGLWLDRSSSSLRWSLGDPDMIENMRFVSAWDGQGLAGYAIAMIMPPASDMAPRLRILDVVVRPALDAASVPSSVHPAEPRAFSSERRSCALALLKACGRVAHEHDLPVMDVLGFGGDMGATLQSFHPLVRAYASQSHLVRWMPSGLSKIVEGAPLWQATMLDGDGWYSQTSEAIQPARRDWLPSGMSPGIDL